MKDRLPRCQYVSVYETGLYLDLALVAAELAYREDDHCFLQNGCVTEADSLPAEEKKVRSFAVLPGRLGE